MSVARSVSRDVAGVDGCIGRCLATERVNGGVGVELEDCWKLDGS